MIFDIRKRNIKLFHAFGQIFLLLAAFFFLTVNQQSIDLKRFHAFGRIFVFAGYLKDNDFKLVQAFGLPFLLAAWALKFLVFAANSSGNSKT